MLALHELSLPQTVQVVAQTYHVPEKRILGVLQAVSAHPSGIGPMGIPKAWLPVLAKSGFPLWKVELMPQWNVAAGTWILAQEKQPAGAQAVTTQTGTMISASWRAHPVQSLTQALNTATRVTGVPASLLAAVILQESGGDPAALSDKGAMGLMQLMPATAAHYGVTNPWNPEQNILGGSEYLAHLLREFHDNAALALAAYNAGSGAVLHYGGIPPYPQTQAYVPAVLDRFQQLERTQEP